MQPFPDLPSPARGRTRLPRRFTWNRSSHLVRSDSHRCRGTGTEHAASTNTAVVRQRDWNQKSKRLLNPISVPLPTLDERRHVKRATAASTPTVCPHIGAPRHTRFSPPAPTTGFMYDEPVLVSRETGIQW